MDRFTQFGRNHISSPPLATSHFGRPGAVDRGKPRATGLRSRLRKWYDPPCEIAPPDHITAAWLTVQRETFPSIDGIFMLDDIVGFVGEQDFREFGVPYFRELYAADVAVKFFHNDAKCEKSIGLYPEIGINLYNPGIFNTLAELRQLSGGQLAILGNIPPRDVLAKGSPADVRAEVKKLLAETPDRSRLILSCAGGMPPGVSTENIRAFVEAARG